MKSKKEYVKIIEDSPLAQGKKEYLAFLDGKRLTMKESILANCYMCMGYYADGKIDCRIFRCALYPFMPYNPLHIKFKAETENATDKDAIGETERADSRVEA